MKTTFINLFFLLVSLYVVAKSCGYGVFEFKNNNNLFGAICVVTFSFISVVFANVVIWFLI